MFKFNDKNTWKIYWCLSGVFILQLNIFLAFNIYHTFLSVSIVHLEQVNISYGNSHR